MKILQIGCGGIGSWLAEEVARAFNEQQIGHSVDYWIADNDIVEVVNIRHQNFTDKDIGRNKADALAMRFKIFEPIIQRVNGATDLNGFGLIVLCVDNNSTREFIFKYCHENNKDFIDLRAEGKRVFAMQKTNDLNINLGTLNLTDITKVSVEENGSCQLKADLERGIIQKGNKIVAIIGIQMLLNHLRGEKNRTIALSL